MTEQDIIDFALTHYGNNRKALVPLLKKRLKEGCITNEIYDAMLAAIPNPMQAKTGATDEIEQRILIGRAKLSDLGDTCDHYIIVANPEIKSVTDWGFTDLFRNNGEIRSFRLWVHWLLPIYYLEADYEKGLENGKWIQWGPLQSLNIHERLIRKKVEKVMREFGYQPQQKEFLKQRFPSLSSDLVRKNASLFESLFSDIQLPCHDHIVRNNGVLRDEFDPQITYGIRRYLNDDFLTVRTERFFYYRIRQFHRMVIDYPVPGDLSQGVLREG